MHIFHTCHIKTETETVIPNNMEYQNLIKKVAQADAMTSLKAARIQLVGEDQAARISRRQSLSEFRIPMKRTLLGLYTIEVIVNHHKLRFILDTGAQISGIMAHNAKQCGLIKSTGTMQVSSVGGKQEQMHGWIAETIQLGALELFQYPLITLDKIYVPFMKMDGIIGWDILSTLDFELDDIAKQCRILKNRYRFQYCNFIQSTFPVMILMDDEKQMHLFGMDSGATTSWVNETIALANQHQVVGEIKAFGLGVHGLEEMHLKVFEGCVYHLFKARITIRNINTGRTDVLPGLQLDGILGNEIFKGRRIRFINSKGMVLLA